MEIYKHRVRYNEVDAQGIVFNAHYLTWCDHALTEYFRMNGWSPVQLKMIHVDLVLRKVEIDYVEAASLDNLLTVEMNVEKIGNTSFQSLFTIKLEEEIKALLKITYINVRNGKSLVLPDVIKEYLASFN